MIRRSLLPALLLPALLLPACESVPRPRTALEYLAHARDALNAKDPDRARWLLESIDERSFREQDLARYKVLLAESYVKLEQYWKAFQTLEEFSRRFPTSEFRPRAELLEYEAGRQLAATGWSLLGIVSDLDDARKILEHFIVAYPRSSHIPKALRILGEAAYQSEDYELAIRRFSQLAQRNPGSTWADRAAFRIAMSHFKLLEGPDYDAGALDQARLELAGYLESETTNETHLAEARAALATTLLWIEEKNLRIARFYLTIEKPLGARRHVERVLSQPDARLRGRAEALMREVDALEKRLAGSGS